MLKVITLMIGKIVLTLLGLSLTATSAIAASDAQAPLKVRLAIGLVNISTDTGQVNCISNIISRSVPSTYANAVAEVEKLKPGFVNLCEQKSGRKVVGNGNPRWDSNQYGDQKIEDWRIHPRDTVVSIQ